MKKKVRVKTALKLLCLACCTFFVGQAFFLGRWMTSYSTDCEFLGPLCHVKVQESSPRARKLTKILRNTAATAELVKLEKDAREKLAIVDYRPVTELAKRIATLPPPISSPTETSVIVHKDSTKFLMIGIPTVGRFNVCYVIDTLRELIQGLDKEDKKKVLIVVFMADFNQDVNTYIKELIEVTFPRDVNKLIHCIRAPRSYYPKDLDFMPLWGQTKLRTNWLGKQSLDYSFLWKYCSKLGYEYYLHLEDDVSSHPGYFKVIKKFIDKHQNDKWSMLEFSNQGSIGKLYRSSQLNHLHKFTWIFSWFYPVDVLIRQFNEFHLYGNPEWSKHQPSLFSHIGSVSSFLGRINSANTSTRLFQIFKFPPTDVLVPQHRKTNTSTFLVIGVPTVKRKKENYLISTLHGLIDGLQESEKLQVLIVIFLSDLEKDAIESITKQVKSKFSKEIFSGLISIVKAPHSYYPSLEGLPTLWGDKQPRVKWRSKQCLDYAFLFNHIERQYPNRYYLHIEDDIIVKKDYFKSIVNFIELNQHRNWSILEFEKSLGFIGWLYRSSDLGKLSIFLRTYFWSLPVDMLCRHFHEFHLYGNPKWALHKPSLFHHGGHASSLDGVTRPATVVPTRKYANSTNPEAAVTTSIKPAMKTYNDISRVYGDKSLHDFFWGSNIHSGDFILLHFARNVNIIKIAVISGGSIAEMDFFGGANILRSIVRNCDEFILWKSFKEQKELIIFSDNPKGTPCSCVKIEVTGLRKDDKNRTRWLFIREIDVWTVG